MATASFPKINRDTFKTIQVNIGYRCNQSCSHCHVNAGPDRKEMMDQDTLKLIPKVIEKYGISQLDITGGAPELHPNFRDLIIESRKIGVQVINRCNLTILDESGQEDLAEFLAKYQVTIIASLPCYEQSNVDKQRGRGVFTKSILGLKKLNTLGYGKKGGKLILNLVYNPQAEHLPPPQEDLEMAYKKELYDQHKIEFNNLFTITNMPIKRFAKYLEVSGLLDQYQQLLIDSYNPANLDHVMCKSLISVDWKGFLYDCDFNQQLGIPLAGNTKHIKDLLYSKATLSNIPIQVDQHCFGCTAGSGSSCGGALSETL